MFHEKEKAISCFIPKTYIWPIQAYKYSVQYHQPLRESFWLTFITSVPGHPQPFKHWIGANKTTVEPVWQGPYNRSSLLEILIETVLCLPYNSVVLVWVKALEIAIIYYYWLHIIWTDIVPLFPSKTVPSGTNLSNSVNPVERCSCPSACSIYFNDQTSGPSLSTLSGLKT